MATLTRLTLGLWLAAVAPVPEQPLPPPLTGPVNDFAGVIDPKSRAELERRLRVLERATGDVIVVATIDTFAPYGDIREYAVKMFENHGRGIGQRDTDNGLLVLLAVRDRAVWIEVGYGLEPLVPDGFAGETARQVMVPAFRAGDYAGGLLAGVTRLAARIAEGRGVAVEDLVAPRAARSAAERAPTPSLLVPLAIALVLLAVLALTADHRRRRLRGRRWGGDPWSGWWSGVGPFGGGVGGFGGGFGGFGGGGGFGGFGGGRSGGGGGGASW